MQVGEGPVDRVNTVARALERRRGEGGLRDLGSAVVVESHTPNVVLLMQRIVFLREWMAGL